MLCREFFNALSRVLIAALLLAAHVSDECMNVSTNICIIHEYMHVLHNECRLGTRSFTFLASWLWRHLKLHHESFTSWGPHGEVYDLNFTSPSARPLATQRWVFLILCYTPYISVRNQVFSGHLAIAYRTTHDDIQYHTMLRNNTHRKLDYEGCSTLLLYYDGYFTTSLLHYFATSLHRCFETLQYNATMLMLMLMLMVYHCDIMLVAFPMFQGSCFNVFSLAPHHGRSCTTTAIPGLKYVCS
jgi:hypothetical protein